MSDLGWFNAPLIVAAMLLIGILFIAVLVSDFVFRARRR